MHPPVSSSNEGSDLRPFPPSSRYRVLATLESGGMGTDYVGSLQGPNGFERRVVIKRVHRQWLEKTETRRALMQEAQVEHPNVVRVRDVEEVDGELLLVLDYVEGASLSWLRAGAPIPPRVAGRILLDVAVGLAAIHERSGATDLSTPTLHREVSPSNILVGTDGSARLADFTVTTRAPAADLLAAGVVAWELLSSRSFGGPATRETLLPAPDTTLERPSSLAAGLPAPLAPIVMRALHRDPSKRGTAHDLAADLEDGLREAQLLGTRGEVAAFVEDRCAEVLRRGRPDPGMRAHSPNPDPPVSTSATTVARKGARNSSWKPVELVDRRSWDRASPIPPVRLLLVAILGAGVAAVLGVLALVPRAPERAMEPSAALAPEPVVVPFVPDPSAPDLPPPVAATAAAQALASPVASTAPLESAPKPSPSSLRTRAKPSPDAPASPQVPADGDTLTARADAARAAHDWTNAASLYRAALALVPRYVPARVGVADLAWDQGRRDEARLAYRTLLEDYPPDVLPARVGERAGAASSTH